MKIVLRENKALGDWYTIVRAEHDGRSWMEKTGERSHRVMLSERLSPEADIEGSSEEMIEIARSILAGEQCDFKRVSVTPTDNGFLFCSPKNSEHFVFIDKENAEKFARTCLIMLSEGWNV